MSWSIEFIIWNILDNVRHSISDNIFDIKLDPEKITGIDYHSQESRNAKISILSDDWTHYHLTDSPYSGNVYRDFWEYAIKIKRNDEIVFIGWVNLSQIKYNKKSDIITFTACDILGMIGKYFQKVNFNNEYTFPFEAYLENMVKTSLYGIAEPFPHINVTSNYNFQTEIPQSGMEINITDELSDITNWDQFFADVNPSFWRIGLGLASDNYGDPSVWNPNTYKTVKHLRLLEDGTPELILCQYRKRRGSYRPSYNIVYCFREGIRILTCKFDDNFLPYDFQTASHTRDEVTSESGSYIDDLFEAEAYWNEYFVNAGYPTTNNHSLAVNDDNTIYFGEYEENPITINYDGIVGFTEITIKEGEYSYNELIKMLLMINNLALKVDNFGNIEIINKDYSLFNPTNITIADTDVLEFTQSRVLRKSPDYSSVLSPLTENVETIATALQNYYDDFIPDFEYSVEILNNYNLKLNDEITIYEKQMIIVEIDKDLDDFSYKIKAWSV